jgi:uncharacterized protein with HEPN domain
MRSDRERLDDARAFIRHARAHLGAIDGQALAGYPEAAHAVTYALVVIGEALGQVSPDIKSLAPAVPWRAIKDVRNRLVHAYWTIDLAIIAGMVAQELGPLDEALGDLTRRIEAPNP